MKRLLSNQKLGLVLRLIVGGVFLYAGILKARSPEAFADSIAAFRILPLSFINLFALGLPVLEVVTGLLLATGFQLRIGAFSALFLSALFVIALLSAGLRGLNIDCGCFGAAARSGSLGIALGRDILLAAMALTVYRQAVISGGLCKGTRSRL